MSVLDDEVKIFLVQSQACFDSPSTAAAAAKEMFPGLDIDRRQAQKYDPTAITANTLGEGLKTLFFETRKRFLEEAAAIGIAHKRVRLRRLDRFANRFEERGNLLAAMQALEQAAKECGDAFTNTRVHSGPGGGPMQAEATHRTDRQLAEVIAQLFAKVMVEDESPVPAAPEVVPSA